MPKNINYIWFDRKRIIFGLPWTFTKYTMTEEKLFISKGLLNLQEEEIRLYRVLDITLTRKFSERIFGLGSLHLCTADKSTPEVNILRIKNSKKVRDLISDTVEKIRDEKGIISREFLGDEINDGENH